ncbi:Cell growth-regulating nucleolar protein [Nymphon striatum]|nr:Cell growth-regulating nucleolar protein [Nymphon striatum]
MVFFTCNACGTAIKKSSVEKHYLTQCRDCTVLSCLDCGKEFWGDDYTKHIKCITEEEKYSGKDYKPKPNQNKNEQKQEQWIEKIRKVISTAEVSPQLSNVLERLITFDNIPRKKIKFLNFVKNSIRTKNDDLVHKAWNVFESALKPAANNDKIDDVKNADTEKKEVKSEESNKSKKKRKHEDETLGSNLGENTEEGNKNEKRKKKENRISRKKRKLDEQNENGTEVASKNNVVIHEKDLSNNVVPEESLEKSDDDNKVSKKFKYEKLLKKLLQGEDDQKLALKKIKKKIMAEYSNFEGFKEKSVDNMWSTIEKKIMKNPKFKVHKDKVTLL